MIQKNCFFTRLIVVLSGFFYFPLTAQLSLGITAGQYREISSVDGLTSLCVRATYNTGKSIILGAGASALKFWSGNYGSLGVGPSILAGAAFINLETFKLYFEAEGGMVYILPEPDGNTTNFYLFIGPSFEFLLNSSNRLQIGLGAFHFSNGKKNGLRQNDTWDGAGLQIGWIFK